jgi:malonyl CoA-acyl carrier protein transacylase
MTERQTESGLVVVEADIDTVIEVTPGQGIQRSEIATTPGIDNGILENVCETMTKAIEGKIDILWLLTQAKEAEINSSQEHIQLFILAIERVTQLSIDKVLAERHGINYGGPGVVFGHSVGEIAALVRKDVIEEAYAAALTYERARLMEEAVQQAGVPCGALVVIKKSEAEVQAAIDGDSTDPELPLLENLRIAAKNDDALFTVSGPTNELEVFALRVRTRPVDTNAPVHNEVYMTEASRELGNFIGKEKKFSQPPDNSVIINGEIVNERFEAAIGITYGVKDRVEFDKGKKTAIAEALRRIKSNRQVIILEVNPGPAKLLQMMKGAIEAHGGRVVPATFNQIVKYGLSAQEIDVVNAK